MAVSSFSGLSRCLIIMFLGGFLFWSYARDPEFGLSAGFKFFSPTSFKIQSASELDKIADTIAGGSATGFGVGKGYDIKAVCYLYKGIGITAGFSSTTAQNKLGYYMEKTIPPDTNMQTVYYEDNNKLYLNTVAIGVAGKFRLPESNVELLTSAGLNVLFAEVFYGHTDDGREANAGARNSCFGPFFGVGFQYRILPWLCIVSEYQFTIHEMEYLLKPSDTVNPSKYQMDNVDFGGSSITVGIGFYK